MKQHVLKLSILLSLLSSSNLFAESDVNAAVDPANCASLANTTTPFILVLNTNDDFIKTINQCAKDAKLKGASVSGVGQLQNPTLAYFSSNPNVKPTLKKFPGFYELASVNGNITNNSDAYYTHLHVVLADSKFRGIAGHINQAKVGLTAEITIVPLASYAERTVNEKTGFGPIQTKVEND